MEAKWTQTAEEETIITLKPTKTKISLDQFGVAWMPFYQTDNGEVAAFTLE
ncbi:MAG: hypothetical protein R3C44_10885 [Chloroflexota bacterium]